MKVLADLDVRLDERRSVLDGESDHAAGFGVSRFVRVGVHSGPNMQVGDASRRIVARVRDESRAEMNVYTRRGDDGTTSLRTGERVRKDHAQIELVGTIDEAQAFLGVARAESELFPEVRDLLGALERDLWILMAEATTGAEGVENGPKTAAKPVPGETAVDQAMVDALEATIDRHLALERFPTAFAVPGENRLSAALDVARTVIRRAERLAVGGAIESEVARAYLNRLSDLCWVLARSVEGEHRVNRRAKKSRSGGGSSEVQLPSS